MLRGDHIYANRPMLGGVGYSHHGIYLGNQRVIHYAGYANGVSGGGSQQVEVIDLDTFLAGQLPKVRSYPARRFSREQVVARAMGRLGEDRYNLLSNNCEHFAAWCCTRESVSPQVRNVSKGAAASLGGSGLLMLARSGWGRQALSTGLKMAGANPWAAAGMSAVAALGLGIQLMRSRP